MTMKIAKEVGTISDVFDHLNRRDEIEGAWLELPVLAFEIDLLEIDFLKGRRGLVEIDAVEMTVPSVPQSGQPGAGAAADIQDSRISWHARSDLVEQERMEASHRAFRA
jgi:hypothetical protein